MGNFFDGDFSICRFTMQADSDGLDFQTLRWDYDTYEQAQSDLPRVAQGAGVPAEECVVVRAYWSRAEEN